MTDRKRINIIQGIKKKMWIELRFERLQFKLGLFLLQLDRMFFFIPVPYEKHDGNKDKCSTDNCERIMNQKIGDISKNIGYAVFDFMGEEWFRNINKKKPVDDRNKIKTDYKIQRKLNIPFPVKKTADQHKINKIGSCNLENPVAKVIDDQFCKGSTFIFSIHSCRSE